MKLYVKLKLQANSLEPLQILKKYEQIESKKTKTYVFSIDRHLLIIDFKDDYWKLIYTLKWINDLIHSQIQNSQANDSLALYVSKDFNSLKDIVFKTGFTFLFRNLDLEKMLSQFSQVLNLSKTPNSIHFEIDFYSKLEYSKIINLQTKRGTAKMQIAKVKSHNLLFSIFWIGKLSDKLDVRIHYQCETSEVFKSTHCDCKLQLEYFLDRIFKNKKGLLIYCHEEGRGLGLFSKINAYYETEINNQNTKKAMEIVAGKTENRFFEIPADIIFQKQIIAINLFTNNPLKIKPLEYRRIIVNINNIWAKKMSQVARKYTNEKIKYMEHINENYN